MPDKDKDKTFILDTSVLLYDASSIRCFGSRNVVIPYAVLEELDKFKTRDGIIGQNARIVARELNDLRQLGPINKGVIVTPKDGLLRVEVNYCDPEYPSLDPKKADDRILNVCLGLKRERDNIVLVTKDINLAVRADVLGIEAQDFDSDRSVSSVSDIYTGSDVLTVSDEIIESFYAGEKICPEDLEIGAYPNQYLTLTSASDPGR